MRSSKLFKRWIPVSTGQISIQRIMQFIGFSTIFLLYIAVQSLNNQGLESRLRLGIRTNSIETTSFQIKMGVSSYFQVILSRSLVSNLVLRALFPGLSPRQGKSALWKRLFG